MSDVAVLKQCYIFHDIANIEKTLHEVHAFKKHYEKGETIVMDGVDRLRDGSKVRVAATAETVRLADNNSPLATESGPDETKDSAAAQNAKSAEQPSGKEKPSEKPVRP